MGGHREGDACYLLCPWKVLGCGTRSSPMLYVITDKAKAISQLGPFSSPSPLHWPPQRKRALSAAGGDGHDRGVTMEGAMWTVAASL